MLKKTLRLVTRQSPLALWQANFVKTQLESIHLNLVVSIQGIKTEGDRLANVSLAKLGGKGLFTKELEESLLNNEADIAVHSMKDMPADLPEGLTLGAILKREDPRDVLVLPLGKEHIRDLGGIGGASKELIVGTSSLRRQAQILALWHSLPSKSLQLKVLRGNVDTRLRKLDEGSFDAIILAAAGLIRLGLRSRISYTFNMDEMMPAVGQGALGIECRLDAKAVLELIAPLHHRETSFCVEAERSMNKTLGGNCEVPVAGFASVIEENKFCLKGLVASMDGKTLLRAEASSNLNLQEAKQMGVVVGKALLEQGAEAIIRANK